MNAASVFGVRCSVFGSSFLRPLRLFAATLLLFLFAAPVFAAGNMVTNGDFERVDEEKKPAYWHYRLTDIMPKVVGENADGTKSYRYVCGCGHDLGVAKPWAGLFCPKCKGFLSGEECGDWYLKNHERVSVDDGANGNAVKFTLPEDVGNNQGVRIFSQLMEAKRGWGYKLSFAVKAKGAHPRVFVEGYRYIAGGSKFASKYMTDVSKELDPDGTKKPLERKFRASVNCETSSSWKTYTKEFVAPEGYQFDWMSVKLYAYMPGEAWFDNVSLVPMTRDEMEEYYKKTRMPKDKRFEHEHERDKKPK
jgi:hypothetical protein